MGLASITSEQELNAWLTDWGITVSSPSKYSEHWWRLEWAGKPPPISCAIKKGDFYVVLSGEALWVYCQDPRDSWFHLVALLPVKEPEAQVSETVRTVISEQWDQLTYRTRHLNHDSQWQAALENLDAPNALSPILKGLLFTFTEPLIEKPSLPELKRSIRELLVFLTKPRDAAVQHFSVVHHFLSVGKFTNWGLPSAYKAVLQETAEIVRDATQAQSVETRHFRRIEYFLSQVDRLPQTFPDDS